jgi:hypothetical protein
MHLGLIVIVLFVLYRIAFSAIRAGQRRRRDQEG